MTRPFAHRRWRAALALVAVGALALAASCSSDPGGKSASGADPGAQLDTVLDMPDISGQTIVINTYGGTFAEAFQKHVVNPFQEATGASVKLVTTCCANFPTTVKNKQYAGDLVLGDDFGPMNSWAEDGYLEDEPRLSEIGKARAIEDGFYNDHVIAVDFYAYVLAWNTDNVKTAPKNWADFYNTDEISGTRGIFALPPAMLETALLGSGTDPDSLYPLEIDKGFDALQGLKDSGDLKTWSDGADLQNKLGTGEFDYAVGFSNRISQGRATGLPIDFTFNEGIRVASGAAIPVGAKNVDGAVAFMDFYMQPKIQAAFAKASYLAPAYESANDELDPDVAGEMVTSAENIGNTAAFNDEFYADHYSDLIKQYQKFLND